MYTYTPKKRRKKIYKDYWDIKIFSKERNDETIWEGEWGPQSLIGHIHSMGNIDNISRRIVKVELTRKEV